MSSQVAICNFAISKTGDDSFITSIDDGTKSARILKVIYNQVRDSLLRAHLWRFARKRATLAPLVTTPAFDGGRYFQLPTDCLRVIGTDIDYEYSYGRWFVEGDKIIADTTALNIVYISRVEDEELFDPLFEEAFATKLAHEMSVSTTQSLNQKEMLAREMKAAIIRAAHAGSTEQDSQQFISEVFIKAHN